jgi:hypothetical protein
VPTSQDNPLPEFEACFQSFVEQGGLDKTIVVSEDYERAWMAHHTAEEGRRCFHGLPLLLCKTCNER